MGVALAETRIFIDEFALHCYTDFVDIHFLANDYVK